MEAAKPVTIPHSRSYDLRSKHGLDYRISAGLPLNVAHGQAVTAMYVLDGDRYFGAFLGAQRNLQLLPGLVPPALVVGIGYDDQTVPAWVRRRSRDFTHVDDPVYREHGGGMVKLGESETGGAADFLQFLREGLIPTVEEGHDVRERLLFGHSLGGLFALHTFLTAPELFAKYLVGSPSIWWARGAIRKEERDFQRAAEVRARVYLGAGEREEATGDPEMDPAQMISNMLQFASILQSSRYPNVEARAHVFPGDNHGSVAAPVINRGLAWLFAP